MGDYSVSEELIEKGINLAVIDESFSGSVLYKKVFDLLSNAKCSPYIEIKRWRAIGKDFIKYMQAQQTLHKMESTDRKRLTEGYGEKSNDRWIPEEDNQLIEIACQGKSELEIATILGRTVSAVHSRLSYLVGIRRLSQNINGEFSGVINGQECEGVISGILNKRG